MGNNNSSDNEDNLNNQLIFLNYGINPNNVHNINNVYYLDLDRKTYKLNNEILNIFDRKNNFSREKEPNKIENFQNIKNI